MGGKGLALALVGVPAGEANPVFIVSCVSLWSVCDIVNDVVRLLFTGELPDSPAWAALGFSLAILIFKSLKFG